MEEKELIIAVINKYVEAQNISSDIPGQPRKNLSRGIKHSISSYLEDIIGAFVADLLDDSFEVWVDQSFTFQNERSQFKPDITIVKKDGESKKIVGFMEVKDSANPFRWNATLIENRGIEYVTDRTNLLNRFRGKRLKFNYNKKSDEIEVSNEAKIDLILFSDRLFSKSKLKELQSVCKGNPMYLHILLKGYHPNVKNNTISSKKLIAKIKGNSGKKIYSESSLRDRLNEILRIKN